MRARLTLLISKASPFSIQCHHRTYIELSKISLSLFLFLSFFSRFFFHSKEFFLSAASNMSFVPGIYTRNSNSNAPQPSDQYSNMLQCFLYSSIDSVIAVVSLCLQSPVNTTQKHKTHKKECNNGLYVCMHA